VHSDSVKCERIVCEFPEKKILSGKMLLVALLITLLTPTISSGGDESSTGEQSQIPTRIVHTKYGALSGTIVQLENLNRNLGPVEVFKGIPYASPPIGSLRFMPPVTGALWSGVKKADR
jgi:hypothetical protein